MMAAPFAARLTFFELPPTEGMLREVPLLAIKLAGKAAEPAPAVLKYNAVYQPPPNASCGRTYERVALLAAASRDAKLVLKTEAMDASGLVWAAAIPVEIMRMVN
jgi:hypothetical protein